MSKNVAVFVDVANIFYAAKAAGVDIDYVTLLKASTAGRDFVRAYAYTGLDPENENQRQFHSFLSRSGYKVVSKDIRKYGDGRIKANLDIELVVDMMRMAQHIDIAVVVSGDGDFAPAIRAVQQQGVRVEVVSFRGNTSSDLIEVADVFTDISHLARVEKGERSGRRVAAEAEDDLSMTEVPEKETDLGPRRRRGGGRRDGRDDRPDRPDRSVTPFEPLPAAAGSNIIALPGERLSRRPAADVGAPTEPSEPLDVAAQVGEDGLPLDETGEASRRRRRRRGGRGRGRGRHGEGEGEGQMVDEAIVEAALEEDELLDEELAPLPQHSTFGSVWDSQIGATPVPLPAAAAPDVDDDEDYEDEPEIPEYLLAERRAQQARGRNNYRGRNDCRGRSAGRAGGYQSAVDRERYGRSSGGAATTSSGGSGNSYNPNRMSDRPRGNDGNRPNQGRPQQPQRQPRSATNEPRRVEPERPAPSAEPWSEVPPEVQEMLRAELARRGPAPRSAPAMRTAATAPAAGPAAGLDGAPPAPAPATRGGRGRRTATPASPAAPAEAPMPAGSSAPAKEATVAATPRRRSTRSAAAPRAEVETAAAPPASAAQPTEATGVKPAPKPRRTASTAKVQAEVVAVPVAEVAEPPKAAAAARRTRAKTTAAAPGESKPGDGPEPAAAGSAPVKPRRRSSKATSDAGEG